MRPEHGFSRKYPYILLWGLLALSLLLTSCGRQRIRQPGKDGAALENSTALGNGTAPESGGAPVCPSQEDSFAAQAAFDFFCTQVFQEEMAQAGTLDLHYTLLRPEAFGISPGEPKLGVCTLEDMIQSGAAVQELADRLAAFDRSLLTGDQALVYDALSETLRASLMGRGLELYEQPLAPTIGVQAQLPILLAEYSFHSLKDVEDYLALLSQTDAYYAQILEFENQKADAGLGPSDASIDRILESCESYRIDPDQNFLTETFAARLAALEQEIPLTAEQKADLHSRHLSAIQGHFIPAYEAMIQGMTALKGRGINDGGLAGSKDGKQYYEYRVKTGPGLSYTVPELKEALKARIQKDYEALGQILRETPAAGLESASFSLTDPQTILLDLQEQMKGLFPELSQCGYEVRQVPSCLEDSLSPAFYLTAPVDDTDQNVIYINGGSTDSRKDLYTTLAHEGFPGHLYQTVYSRTHAKTPLSALLSCSGANEGWATYVENIACTFDNGLSRAAGEYRAHMRSLSLCVHGLLDIGINYDGWDEARAGEFIRSCFQADDQTVRELWQVMIDNPANYLEYCGGYIEYMDMREQAEAALGSRFSPLEFHKLLLDLGPVPFSVIRPRFTAWLEEQVRQAAGPPPSRG